MNETIKVAILDNAVDHRVYTPIDHWAQYLDVPWEAFYARAGRLPSLDDGFSHFIITGSESSILDREPWADAEAEFVREAVRRDLALLGSCWGHQLVAYALDGPGAVVRCRRPEIGWIAVEKHVASGLLGEKGTAYSFSLHFDEVIDVSNRFRVLASTAVCPLQAIALPEARLWGLQIHPEIDIPAARKLLNVLLGANPRTDPLYEAALRSEPRDSGLIRGIVNYFLSS